MALTGQASSVVHGLGGGEQPSSVMRLINLGIVVGLGCLCVVGLALYTPLLEAAVAVWSGVAASLLPVVRRAGGALQLVGTRAPALAFGLGAIVLAIPVAIVAGLVRWALNAPVQGADPSPVANAQSAGDARLDDMTGFALPRRAWFEGKIAGVAFQRDLKLGLIRIGRESDNDIALPSSREIERYHAAIEHTREHDIYLSDLTRGAKGQVRVNGRRCSHRRLRDGDRITCPGVALTFHTAST